MSNRFIIIAGCSGGGKSTLIKALSLKYSAVEEVGRKLVQQALLTNSEILPWRNPTKFCQALISHSIAVYNVAKTKTGLVFFDRSLLDGLSYYHFNIAQDNPNHQAVLKDYPYYHILFMAPPWPEIFCQDDERKHSFDAAKLEYEQLVKFYTKAGYQLIELPKVTTQERMAYIEQQPSISNNNIKLLKNKVSFTFLANDREQTVKINYVILIKGKTINEK